MSEVSEQEERPTKRQKLDGADDEETTHVEGGIQEAELPTDLESGLNVSQKQDEHSRKESKVGITELIHPENQGFFGVLKKRYEPPSS